MSVGSRLSYGGLPRENKGLVGGDDELARCVTERRLEDDELQGSTFSFVKIHDTTCHGESFARKDQTLVVEGLLSMQDFQEIDLPINQKAERAFTQQRQREVIG